MADAAEKQQKAAAAAQVMADAFDPVTKVFDFAKYAKGMAALGATPDDKVLAATYASGIPKHQLATGANGELDVVDVNHPEGGPIWHRDAAPKVPATPFGWDPTTHLPTPEFLRGTTEVGRAEREGKPLEGRAPPKAPARGAFDPSEVKRKNPGS